MSTRPSRTHNKRKEQRECILNGMRDKLTQLQKTLLPFGPAFSQAPGTLVVDSVICHRFLSKYEVPEARNAKERANRSIQAMLVNDVPHPITWGNESRMAKARLAHWFRGFRPSYRFAAPNGASAQINADSDDILAKLTSLDQWEVSPELADYAANICWNNHALKRMVKRVWNQRFPHCLNDHLRSKYDGNGYRIFQVKFKSLVTYNSSVRVVTVPKNNDTDRVIGCVPLWDMICQLSWMYDIRAHMRKRLGYDVNTRGDLHKTLLPHEIATIDLKTASDLVQNRLVEGLWPEHMLKVMRKLRNQVIEYDGLEGKEYHYLNMFAPMGLGITFDVMTFTLLALLRDDQSASVFGDDIIVKATYATQAVRIIEDHGLVVNKSKSFITGKFRESCGGMWHDDVGYITSFDFHYPVVFPDWLVTCNKLRILIDAGQCSYELQGILLEVYNALIATMPRVVFGASDVSLSSSCITGFEVRNTNRITIALSEVWQRECSFTTAYVTKVKPWRHKGCPHATLAMTLFRGVVDVPTTDKVVVSYHTDTETGTRLMSIPLPNLV